jgi:sarcosine oxidase, subunit gamma
MSEVLSPEKQQMASTNQVAVMDQYSTLPAQSPVFDSQKHFTVQPTPNKSGVVMKEVALMGYLVLRGNPECENFVNGVTQVLGLELPIKPLSSSANDVTRILWLAPDEWLIISSGDMVFDIEVALREKIRGHFSIVNQSGGQTMIELSGVHAADMLRKSTPLDSHPRAFPIGKVATSLLAKSSAIFYHAGEDQWHLVIRRSFADYIWRWLGDAGKEFGLVIEK